MVTPETSYSFAPFATQRTSSPRVAQTICVHSHAAERGAGVVATERSAYARVVDAELEEEVERIREAPAREVQAPERFRDEQGDLQRAASSVGNRSFGQRRLAGDVSQNLEASVGGPLGDVRVHTDDHAAALARAVSARAFTVGSDIYFGSGEYNPGTRDGAQLIAHEAAHVVQQRGAPRSGPLTVSQPGEPLEREAEAVARGVTA